MVNEDINIYIKNNINLINTTSLSDSKAIKIKVATQLLISFSITNTISYSLQKDKQIFKIL